MNIYQMRILELSARKNIWEMTLQEIGNEIGAKNRGLVKYHLDQLTEKEKIQDSKREELVTSLRNSATNSASKKLVELFNGLATNLTSGGEMFKFFDERAKNLMFEEFYIYNEYDKLISEPAEEE